jgi:peptide methionine sulfoxide reductase MsrB
VFEVEGYGTPTDQRYCINSISLRLEPKTIPVDGPERLDREQLRSDR